MANEGAPLIEAAPNFSEGRRQEVIAAIVAAIQASGVLLLGVSSDAHHNRTVVTVAGPPEDVLEGLFCAVKAAAERIDLHVHRGAHPRLGATDVVPLAPLRNITLAECAVLAHRLGRRIGEELALPVYLYEAAATRPERRNLADVRCGEFEALAREIGAEARRPDYGPAAVGPAGAVIVGARTFLIAYNFYLDTGDVAVAKAVAHAIRARDGGLPGVKALGFLVDGQAQVSVNLVDYTLTPLHALTAAVEREAAARGARFVRAELVGLIPQAALLAAAAHYLKLPGLAAGDVIETALAAAAETAGPKAPLL